MNPEDDPISITLGDTIYTAVDDDFVLTGASQPQLVWEGRFNNPSIKIGKHEITEETAEKLQALLDVIDSLEDDNDLKALFNTQLAFNRIKNTDEIKSD